MEEENESEEKAVASILQIFRLPVSLCQRFTRPFRENLPRRLFEPRYQRKILLLKISLERGTICGLAAGLGGAYFCQ